MQILFLPSSMLLSPTWIHLWKTCSLCWLLMSRFFRLSDSEKAVDLSCHTRWWCCDSSLAPAAEAYFPLYRPSFSGTWKSLTETGLTSLFSLLWLTLDQWLANKSLTLNDFFMSRDLNFMLLMETLLCAGQCTAFSEFLPPDCSFFSTPCTTGKGGGLATIFQSLSWISIYFLALLFHISDCFLVIGDFNIHVCYPSKNIIKEFGNVLESLVSHKVSIMFNKWKEPRFGPCSITRVEYLQYRFYFIYLFFFNNSISDHFPVLFTVNLPCCHVKQNISLWTRWQQHVYLLL